MALYFVFQLVYLFTVFDGSIAMRLLLFFVEKIIEILGMALGDILAIWLIPDYMYYYLLDNVRGVWYFNASIAASELIIMGLCWGIIRLIRYVQSRNARLDIMAYILIPASQFILFFITLVLYANETKTAIFNPYGVAGAGGGDAGRPGAVCDDPPDERERRAAGPAGGHPDAAELLYPAGGAAEADTGDAA